MQDSKNEAAAPRDLISHKDQMEAIYRSFADSLQNPSLLKSPVVARTTDMLKEKSISPAPPRPYIADEVREKIHKEVKTELENYVTQKLKSLKVELINDLKMKLEAKLEVEVEELRNRIIPIKDFDISSTPIIQNAEKRKMTFEEWRKKMKDDSVQGVITTDQLVLPASAVTPLVLRELENESDLDKYLKYLTSKLCREIACDLGLSEIQVQAWFK